MLDNFQKVLVTGGAGFIGSHLAAVEAVVFLSFYEGFGLPPIEAVRCGPPAIVSNTSCFPEICGEAALMVEPQDIDQLATSVWQLISDDDLKRPLREKGLERAKIFSWQRCAGEHLKLYEELFKA